MIVQTVATADGTVTLYVPELDEHYHSVHGARQESLHVFIQNGLEEISHRHKCIRIFEMGFGTGLNAWLTYLYAAEKNLEIEYTAIDIFPLRDTITCNLNYVQKNEKEVFEKLHAADWNKSEEISSFFRLKKIQTSLEDYITGKESCHLIYFDAFAPVKQPQLWTEEIFRKMHAQLSYNGILVTYCAKGEVRRAMIRSGFSVERLKGPPGKREMLRAKKSTA